MKKILFLFMFVIWGIKILANPSFTIGSNYYLTVFAYPHEILKWPKSAVFFYFNPQTLPWQGDVTNIMNRPSESYVSNYQVVEFAPPYGYSGNPDDVRSWMEVAAYAYKKNYSIGGIYNTRFGKILAEIGNSALNMQLKAEGTGRASEDINGVTQYRLIPFKGETNAQQRNLNLKLIYANYIFDNPLGIKFSYVNKSSRRPTGHLSFTKEGESINTSHLTWGWATFGCSHIFGYSHINADAFFQNRYSVFNGNQMDIQLSYEFNGNYKTGIRYRRKREDGENYSWKYNDGSDYLGDYKNDEYWKDENTVDLIRGYSKVRFWRAGDLDAGVLFFVQHAKYAANEVNKLIESDPASEQNKSEFIIETNPFINYQFNGGYTDFGILMELSYTGMSNTSTRWNNASKSDQKDVLWSTSPYNGWSPSWENFSKGSELFFATGFESYSSISVYKRLSLLLQLTILRKFTHTTKFYGESQIPDGNNSFKFIQSHKRNNYKSETWMTASFGISYGLGPVQMFLTLQTPLAYLIKQKTNLSDTNQKLFEHEKMNTWQVQEPTTMKLLLVYSLGGN
ncbi:hypothetical protein ISS22_17310 [candidate division KSB1 bacterium]|nr:hypothetical protein [candidate division KSB1 bacterium]